MSQTLTLPLPRAALTLHVPAEAIGLVAGLAAATIWGATLAMTRLGVADAATSLGPHDLVLLRFIGPAALLLPVVLRVLPRLCRADLPHLLVLFAGGGAPFVLLAGAGMQEASAADAGALLPGSMPLWVAAVSLLAGQRGLAAFSACQRLGFALMALAVALVAGPALLEGTGWRGPALLIAASWLAALYTLALRRAGLTALEATALVSLGSVLGFAPLYLLAMEPGIGGAAWAEIALHTVWQGGLSGLLAPMAFAVAVAKLGAARAAAFGALSPATAALFGLVLLGEMPEPIVAAGLVAAGLGVALATREARQPQGPRKVRS
ncbi:EamA family transporter [Falsiroseomonas sp.]|uniref:EamA family transporter n=1 Tax=Falsiroseomonas sp. TaxID=2870721 RepID=UPI003561872B